MTFQRNTARVKRIMVVLSLSILFLMTYGCKTVEKGLSLLERPSAKITGSRLARFGFRESTLEFDVRISNPYSVPLPVGVVTYSLYGDEEGPFLSGTIEEDGSIPAKGEETIRLPVQVTYQKLTDVLKKVRPGEVVPYRAKLTLSIRAPGGDQIDLPVTKRDELPVPAVPNIKLDSVRWQELGITSTTAQLNLKVKNPHVFSVNLKEMDYLLEMDGRTVVESSVSDSPQFDPSQVRTLKVPVTVSMSRLGSGILSVFRQDRVSYGLRGDLNLGTPYGTLSIPYDVSGRTELTGE